MPELVTFVFTDLVGSVDLKGKMPGADAAERDEAYVRSVLTPHRERIEAGLSDRGGRVVSTAGDGHFLAFRDTIQAALWAIGVQRSHAERPISIDADEAAATVRIGIHVGPPQVDPGDADNFIGRAVDYAARLADRASAGQILASRSAASLLEDAGLEGLRLHSHGRRSLRGIGEVEVHELLFGGQAAIDPRGEESPNEAPTDQRDWTVLPPTMSLTQYSGAAATADRGSSATDALTAAPKRRLGNYELGELIGAGGMGNVYRARHTLFGRTRAVKLIKPELVAAGGDSVVRRFYQEVQATGAIEHPNLVVAIDSSAPEDDEHYLVMEYIDGVGVDRVLTAEGRLAVADACEVARQAALGLSHLHEAGLVHRDVKPSNLMLAMAADHDASGDQKPQRRAVVKLMDLGLALLERGDRQRVTRLDHRGMGTGHYMSPEQWRTTTVDIRADIYSLGCTLHHLLRGQPPYADSDLRPEKAHEREPIPPLERGEAPAELSDLLDRMMAKRPDDRPQTPLDVAKALSPFSTGHDLGALVGRHRSYSSGGVEGRLAGPIRGSGDTFGDRAAIDTPARQATPVRSTVVEKGGGRGAVWAGLLAIALLVAGGLAWLASERHDRMLELHRKSLEQAAQASAERLAAEIEKRFLSLQILSGDSQLRAWVAELDSGDSQASRTPLREWIAERKSDQPFASNSWFVTDSRGVQIARWPPGKSVGKSYAHRDYFHGEGPDRDPEQAEADPPSPIAGPHQSTVYRSDSTGELKVAFSTPIQSGDAIVGVLAMSVALGEFEPVRRGDDDEIELLLANTKPDYVESGQAQRGLVLQHRELEQYRGRVFRIEGPPLEALDAGRRSGFLDAFEDVFGRSESPFWGAYTRVESRLGLPSTGWVVISQEQRP